MERFVAPGKPTVVVDYAHTPGALAAALDAARQHCGGRLWVVFGCGGDRDPGKRPLMGKAACDGADRVVITSDNPRSESPEAIIDDIRRGCGAAVQVEADREAAIARALAQAADGDLILIAGKGHETTQVIGAEVRPFSDRETVRSLLGGGAA
jgi:UDP-N-acetylmuramoyl-L-alanyl-D-glutamate--2,6-diaminopimelate ligase